MASLDVSDAFSEEFWNPFTLVTRLETTNDKGRPVVVETTTPDLLAVITAASPNDLQRWPEADISLKSIIIVGPERVQLARPGPTADQTYKADVVLWKGNAYQVGYVDDYSDYGEGYMFVIAQMTDYTPNPATPNPLDA